MGSSPIEIKKDYDVTCTQVHIILNMNIVNFSEEINNFKSVLDTVAHDKNCTVIVRRDEEDAAVVMSKSYYDSLMETIYLLKSPANAQHLEEAIAEYKAGKTQEHNLIDASTSLVEANIKDRRSPDTANHHISIQKSKRFQL
jgi:antitoxin YefM